MSSLVVRGGSVDLAIDGERIVAAGEDAGAANGSVTTLLDASGCAVLPGFVDVQLNGAVGVDLTSRPERLAEVSAYLPQTGVTSFMPTVISSDRETTTQAVVTLERIRAEGLPGARSLGTHLEGPWLNPRRAGAHPVQNLRASSAAEVTEWTQHGVAMVTLAPEIDGAIETIVALAAAGVVVCAGHAELDAAVLDAAVAAGVTGATHLFNAMGTMSARSPGTAGAILDHPSLIVGLIVDGVHVDPAMVRLAWRVLGPHRIALVTDAIGALGLPEGAYGIGQTRVVVDAVSARTADGTLAGSILRFDDALRNLLRFTGCTLADASIAASTTPATLARRTDVGRLEPGCLGDAVLLDEDLRVAATVVGGRVVHDPDGRSTWKS